MYADLEEAEARRSVKERLNVHSSRFRTPAGKRQRQDKKWEHDRFNELHLSNRKVAAHDLRLKLQKKGLGPALESGQPVSKVSDLFVKLAGIAKKRPATTAVAKVQKAPEPPNATLESAVLEASVSETKSVAIRSPKKKHQKDNTESFLESLGLEKYWITFQAEEVDMTVLKHMTDEDLKSLGIPMGPRKKILLAFQSKLHA